MIPKTQFILTIVAVVLVLSLNATAATQNVLYAFTGGADGGLPFSGGVVFDNAGKLYGTTQRGGAHGQGTVFQLSPSSVGRWTESVLYSFSGGSDGGLPAAGVILDHDGNVYGTASQGGDPSCLCGVVFKLTQSGNAWTETILYTFHPGADGHFPLAGLAFDGAGSLYGTTAFGGHPAPKCSASGCGIVFKLTLNGSSWSETVLHYFNGNDGASPQSGVIIDSLGFIYGTATRGGNTNGDGSAFKLSPTGKVARLYKFTPTNKSGASPTGGLILDGSGNVYGTNGHSPAGSGAVFELTLNPRGYWKAIALHTFIDSDDGAIPIGGLTFDATRTHLYGATAVGGADPGRGGTIFQLTPVGDKWMETHLYDFTGGNDGGFPLGALVFDDAGNLYGVTSKGGAFDQGVVFQIQP